MCWAMKEWHIVKALALTEGVITTAPHGPASLLDLSADHFLTYAEALVRRLMGDEAIDEIYEESAPKTVLRGEERARQIRELEAMFDR